MDDPDRAAPPTQSDQTDVVDGGGEDWRQLNISFGDWAAAETAAATHLAPILHQARERGLISAWFFVRKSPCWRLRYRPAGDPVEAADHLGRGLARLPDQAQITDTNIGIYEPETHAFGGMDGMAHAHQLFHTDSRHLLAHISNTTHTGQLRHRRELAIVLCSALLRGAGLDWYEQGDVWARVADHRVPGPTDGPLAAYRLDALEPSVRRLLTVDPAPLLADSGPLNHVADWYAEFTDAGTRIAALAATGRLYRGARAVLAHHVIFTWNRHGLPFAAQAALSHTAKRVIFGPEPATNNATA